jgi:hypothetical protein
MFTKTTAAEEIDRQQGESVRPAIDLESLADALIERCCDPQSIGQVYQFLLRAFHNDARGAVSTQPCGQCEGCGSRCVEDGRRLIRTIIARQEPSRPWGRLFLVHVTTDSIHRLQLKLEAA